MMSRKKRILIIVLSIVAFLFLFATWYQYTYSMDEAVAFEVNSTENSRKLIIATQGSEFKNNITKNVFNHFKQDSIFIKVIDVSSLKDIEVKDYDAILLIHTWENWKPPIQVKNFLDRTKAYKNRIVVITTSGEGSYKMEGVDAITGESKPDNIASITKKTIKKLELLLQKNNKI